MRRNTKKHNSPPSKYLTGSSNYVFVFIGFLLTIWCIYFFRNPNRVIPDAEIDKFLILAPADGKIVEVLAYFDETAENGEIAAYTASLEN